MLVSWAALYIVWFLLGIPWGPVTPSRCDRADRMTPMAHG
jgi:p-aminobenzoyl-glutamate transporter AbgT